MRRCTTGTCRRRWTIAAAGSIATAPTGSPNTRQRAVRALDDRVPMWATLNEPWVVTDGGYLHGALAPGHRNLFEAPIATHNLLRAHGAAVQAYRAKRAAGKIGLVVNLEPKYPATDSDEDRGGGAARRRVHEPAVPRSGVLGELSRRDARDLRRGVARVAGRGLRAHRQQIDFLGINYYTRGVTQHDPTALPLRAIARAAAASTRTRRRAGRCFPRRSPIRSLWVTRALRQHPALHHRERRGVLRSAAHDRRTRATIRCASSTTASTCAPSHEAIAQGVRPARLLRLVAARQLRVEPRLLQALRHRARRLRHAAADAQVERAASTAT